MKYTNNKGLPEPLVVALKAVASEYDKGLSDYTATGLLNPPRAVELERRHGAEVQQDVYNLIASAHGTVIHSMLEAAGKTLDPEKYIVERRFYIDVAGKRIGAKLDFFDIEKGVLYDWKNSSVYSIKRGLKEDHVRQLNIGAECLRQAGFTVKELRIANFPTDYREWERKDFKWYPERYSEFQVPLIPSEEVIAFVEERVKAMLAAQAQLPLCTPAETWGGNRCSAGWCKVASVCEQYQKKIAKKENK